MKVKKENMAASISGPLRSYLRKSLKFSNLLCKFRRLYSSDFSIDKLSSNSETFSGEENLKSKDPRVQKLLKRLIARNVDLDKVFKARKEPLKLPTYQLLTDEEVVQAEKLIMEEALKRLEMPVVMHKRKEIDMVLQKDPDIEGHDESNFIFTDISTSANDRNRRIVVREPNGVLREAAWEERERMNYIYFPKEGQKFQLPPMLTEEHLPNIFEQNRHVDALDLVSIQCQPDSPDYIRVHEHVYDNIDRKSLYHLLESTRHYGGMVFYLVSNKRINGLIFRMIKEERIEDAADILRLLYIIHPESEPFVDLENSSSHDLLLVYAQKENLDEIISFLTDENLEQTENS